MPYRYTGGGICIALQQRRDAVLKTTEIAKQAVHSGITPIRLLCYPVRLFDREELLLRSVLHIQSLDLGVLTPGQYRFVARRTKQGDALVERHLNKLFSVLPAQLSQNRALTCVTIPVFPRVLLSGKLTQLLFSAFGKFPGVDPRQVCIELSSDILFEDFASVTEQLTALRRMGVKLAVSEVGDDFCPLTQLSALKPDFVFADAASPEQLQQEGDPLENLAKFLHLAGIRVFLPPAQAPWREAGFDGILLPEPLEWEVPQ